MFRDTPRGAFGRQKLSLLITSSQRAIERFHVMSSPSRLRRKTENSCHVGVQEDRSFYGDLYEMNDILIMLLICVESDKIPSLHKLKQLYKRLSVDFLIDIAYTANNILCRSCVSFYRKFTAIT